MIKNCYRWHGREPAWCFQRTSQRAWRWLIKCFSSAASPKIMPQTSSLRFAPHSIRNCAGAWDAELGILSLTPSLHPSPAFGSSRRIDGSQLRRIALLLISREADGFGVPNFLKGKNMDEIATAARTRAIQAPDTDVLFQPYRLGPF